MWACTSAIQPNTHTHTPAWTNDGSERTVPIKSLSSLSGLSKAIRKLENKACHMTASAMKKGKAEEPWETHGAGWRWDEQYLNRDVRENLTEKLSCKQSWKKVQKTHPPS